MAWAPSTAADLLACQPEPDLSPARPFAGAHYARYLEPGVPYHIISRVFQGRCLLVPDDHINDVIVGVLSRARELYPHIRLFAIACMSNHIHAMLTGPAHNVAAFLAFVKREISRRLAPHCDWYGGTMWNEYLASALPTPDSQEQALRYILAQGVKEELVERAQDWPGVHAAKVLATGAPLMGHWLDATAYGRARRKRRAAQRPGPINMERFRTLRQLTFDPIPAWISLSPVDYQQRIATMLDDIEIEGRALRQGRPVLGPDGVRATPRTLILPLPRPPWFEDRRRMICWCDMRAPEAVEYLDRYRAFQRAFREASSARRSGRTFPPFPEGAFSPPYVFGNAKHRDESARGPTD